MRMIVFFDLPTTSVQDRKIYADFRKKLIKEGFVMMQQSVYTKVVLNSTNVRAVSAKLDRFTPTDGVVQLLTVTERQFASMEYLTGECTSGAIQNTERIVVL